MALHNKYIHSDGKAWEIELDGKKTITTFGKIGGRHRTLTKTHVSKTQAEEYVSKQTKDKLVKGYFQEDEKNGKDLVDKQPNLNTWEQSGMAEIYVGEKWYVNGVLDLKGLYEKYGDVLVNKYLKIDYYEKGPWYQIVVVQNKPIFKKVQKKRMVTFLNSKKAEAKKLNDQIEFAFELFDLNMGADSHSHLQNQLFWLDIKGLQLELEQLVRGVNERSSLKWTIQSLEKEMYERIRRNEEERSKIKSTILKEIKRIAKTYKEPNDEFDKNIEELMKLTDQIPFSGW